MFLVFPKLKLRISVLSIPIMMVMLWVEGFLPFAVMLLSAFIHELGHLFAVKKCGYRIRRLDLLPMGALIVLPEGISDSDEIQIAIFGPLFSLIGALVFSIAYSVNGSALALFGTAINLAFGLFNLLPVEKFDGGKALCCYLADRYEKNKAEQICSAASFATKIVFALLSVFLIIISGYNLGVFLLCLSLMLQIIAH